MSICKISTREVNDIIDSLNILCKIVWGGRRYCGADICRYGAFGYSTALENFFMEI